MGWSSIFTNANGLKLSEPYTALDNLVDAVNERNSATDRDILTMSDKLDSYDIIDDIQSEITALIPLFVNHTDNGGSWDNQDDEAPNWTEADILTAIGAPARLIPSRFYVDAEWLWQCYEILNLLRWTKEAIQFTGGKRVKADGGGGYTFYEDSWAELVAVWNAATWQDVGYGWAMEYQVTKYVSGSFGLRNTGQYRMSYPHTGSYSIDTYVYASTAGAGSMFQPIASAPYENKYNRAKQQDEATYDSTNEFLCIPDADFSPAGKTPATSGTYVWYSGGGYQVLKFDGTNGFQFKDW